MIVKEMLRRLRIILNDVTEPYKVSTDQLYLLIQNAYMDIQVKSTQWKFFHKRGLLFTTKLDTPDYNIRNVRYIEQSSIYAIENGSTQRVPLLIKEYADWIIEQASGIDFKGTPLYLVHLPDFTYKIEPVPETIWDIYADYWITPTAFRSYNDSPIWADEFHDLVLLESMKTIRMLQPDSKASLMMEAQIKTRLPQLWRAFVNIYLPNTRGANTFL